MKAVAIVKRAFQAYYADLRYYLWFTLLGGGIYGVLARTAERSISLRLMDSAGAFKAPYILWMVGIDAFFSIPAVMIPIAVRIIGRLYPATLGNLEGRERLRRIFSAYAALLLSRACFYIANSCYGDHLLEPASLFAGVIVLAISPAMAFSALAALKNGRGPIGAIRQGMAAFYRHPVKYFLPFFAFAAGSRLFQQCFSWLGTAAADGFLAVFPFNEELVLSVSAQLYIRYAVENMFVVLTEPIVMAAALQTFVFFENADSEGAPELESGQHSGAHLSCAPDAPSLQTPAAAGRMKQTAPFRGDMCVMKKQKAVTEVWRGAWKVVRAKMRAFLILALMCPLLFLALFKLARFFEGRAQPMAAGVCAVAALLLAQYGRSIVTAAVIALIAGVSSASGGVRTNLPRICLFVVMDAAALWVADAMLGALGLYAGAFRIQALYFGLYFLWLALCIALVLAALVFQFVWAAYVLDRQPLSVSVRRTYRAFFSRFGRNAATAALTCVAVNAAGYVLIAVQNAAFVRFGAPEGAATAAALLISGLLLPPAYAMHPILLHRFEQEEQKSRRRLF